MYIIFYRNKIVILNVSILKANHWSSYTGMFIDTVFNPSVQSLGLCFNVMVFYFFVVFMLYLVARLFCSLTKILLL